MPTPLTLEAFVLTRAQRETPRGLMLEYWLATPQGPVRARMPGEASTVFFVERTTPVQAGVRRELQLRTAVGAAVDGVYFDSLRDLRDERDRLLRAGHAVFEGDVLPSDRHLMERFIAGSGRVSGMTQQQTGYLSIAHAELRQHSYTPTLRAASFDVETDGFEGEVLSIAVVCDAVERVFMRGAGPAPPDCQMFGSEATLITAFCKVIRELDPDLLLGWNVIEFDLAVLLRRAKALGVSLSLGRDGSQPDLGQGKPPRARIAGRVVLDGIASLRAASHMLESYALQDVAEQFLGRGKAMSEPHGDRVAEIRRMFQHDRAALARYNLEDCRLVRDIFAHLDLIGFLVERARLTGLALDRVRGAVAAFDYVYLPRLHRAGFVAPTVDTDVDVSASPGGYVLDSVPGLHDNVIVLDFKSLYPSIIRTYRIDPLGLWVAAGDVIPGFAGGSFDREQHILPELIAQLWRARDEAKAKRDSARSYAIKILMNSFYGVLGTPACRFFDPKLASSITLRGHEIITHSRMFLQAQGHAVIYGDTDSLFVKLSSGLSPDACESTGRALALALNTFWRERVAREHRLDSQLEVQFDKHYLRFFMPTLRDSTQGSKKRYAGLTRGPAGRGLAVDFKGLEAVRSDWTPLARRFQRELYRRVFCGEPYEVYVRTTVAELFAGKLDHELMYRKRLRRELAAYVKNVPPHVRAARKLATPTREVAYFMTIRGPEPATDDHDHRAPLDHRHYLERQLAPAADTLLQQLGTSLARVLDTQLSLF